MTEHFPVLLVVVPLLAAPLIALSRSASFGWAASLAASAACLFMALALHARVSAVGTISYAIGNWPPPWGIEYRIDAANAFVAVLVSLVAVVVVPYCRRCASAEIGTERLYLFYALLMLCLAGLLGMTATGDAFNLFVFMEIASLSSYVLIALGQNRRALTAALQYLLLGTVGATLYVIGVGMLYLHTGTLNLADMSARLTLNPDLRPVLAALAFIFAGVGLKLALFPLHGWLPNAYAYAPSPVSVFLSATATKVSVYVLMRVLFTVLGVRLAFSELPLGGVLVALSLAALFVASTLALMQADLKRLLAYSSVAQIGYITLGLSFASEAGLTASMAHVFNHGITKAALFMLAGCFALRLGGTGFGHLAGVGRTMPITAFAFVVGGLSLIGVPGTAGFASKWMLVVAALEAGRPWIAFAVLASSLLAVAYVWKFVECAWFREPPPESPRPGEANASLTGPALALTALVVVTGVHATPVLEAARLAARALLGSAA